MTYRLPQTQDDRNQLTNSSSIGLFGATIKQLRELTLPRGFYLRDTFTCLRDVLGKVVIHIEGDVVVAGRIVEVEAYIGGTDKASHSYRGKITPRTEIQFGIGGHAYIFMVHTHHQFCLVTREVSVSDVILIRAIEPILGIDTMKERRNYPQDERLLGNGPGKLCQSLNITKDLYGIDLTDKGGELLVIDDELCIPGKNLVRTARVGIDYAEEFKDVPWRFYIKGNRYVSKK